MLPLGEAGRRVYGNSLNYFCNFSTKSKIVSKYIFSKKREKKKLWRKREDREWIMG